MKRNIRWLCGLLACVLCTLFLVGCEDWFGPKAQREYLTDEDGNRYYLINENYFKFDSYNVLEVVVSDSEKFILYDYNEDDTGELGVGEWIKDGISYPVRFHDDDLDLWDSSGRHGNIVICGNFSWERLNYWIYEENGIFDTMPYNIAMINNNPDDPGLYRGINDTQYNTDDDFDKEKIHVQYFTYTREDLSDWDYIPEKAMKFYTVDSDEISFVSEELNLCFNGKTGKGTWTLNDVNIPVVALFDRKNFTLSVSYDTTDERQGIVIFTAKGTTVNDIIDNEATFTLTSFPKNCNYENIETLKIRKVAE